VPRMPEMPMPRRDRLAKSVVRQIYSVSFGSITILLGIGWWLMFMI